MAANNNSPAKGYVSNEILPLYEKIAEQNISKTIREATNASSKALKEATKTSVSSGFNASAINKAVESARSASDKLGGALGGKLSSVLGTKLGDATSAIGSSLTKKVSNYATGQVAKLATVAQQKLTGALNAKLGSAVGGLLASRLSNISDVGAKNLGAAKLIQGFLETGPRDETLVADVYDVSDNTILNDLGDKITGFAKDKFEELRRSPGLITDLTSMVFKQDSGWSLTTDGLKDRILSSLGGKSGLINGLTSSLQSTIVNGLGVPPDVYQTAIAVIDGQNYRFSTSNMKSAKDVFSMINTVTNTTEVRQFIDVGSESALLSGVMREAIALGVPDSVEVLVTHAKTSEVAYNALLANMQVALEYSDLDTLLLMIDRIGAEEFLSKIPDAVTVLLTHYKLPVDTSAESYQAELVALTAVLDAFDDAWDTTTRDGVNISSLSPFVSLSDDAKTLFQRSDNDDYVVASLIAESYPPTTSVRQELKAAYPLVPFTP